MSAATCPPFELGPWRVEPLLHQLVRLEDASRDGSREPKHITPKTMEVSLLLAENSGGVVTRETLLDGVWPETHIREDVITRSISDLRSALEDDRRAPRFIETIPKVGYSHFGAGRIDGQEDREPDNIDVYILASGGGEPRRLTRDPAADAGATWSPDGLRLAFGRYRSSEGEPERCSLIEVPVSGGPERRLGSCGNNGTADFAWSPSGEWIAFSDRREGDTTFGIYLLSTLSGEGHLLVAPNYQHWGDRDPQFSPDGRQVALTRSVSMNAERPTALASSARTQYTWPILQNTTGGEFQCARLNCLS